MKTFKAFAVGAALFLAAACTTVGVSWPVNDYERSFVDIGMTEEGVANGQAASGVFIAESYVLTAAHVVKQLGPSDRVFRVYGDEFAKGEVVWIDAAADLAVVRLNKTGEAAELACREPVVGEPVANYGNPGDLKHALTTGIVAATTVYNATLWKRVFATDSVGTHGSSGSPIFDADGNVLGILVSGMYGLVIGPVPSQSQVGISYAVPVVDHCDAIEAVIE